MSVHRFDPKLVPGEGYHSRCSCGWVSSPADIQRTYVRLRSSI